MGDRLRNRIDIWKKLLLDFGKRNRLINFIEGKRSNIEITSPTYDRVFDLIVIREKELQFSYAQNVSVDANGDEICDAVIKGDLETNKPFADLQKTLKVLRYRANTFLEEQGINTLYLAFGLLKWTEREDSDQILSSPLILVPVKLTIESLTSPYKLVRYEDEIVVNPTLLHKLENDFGIKLPEFDGTQDDIIGYLNKLEHIISTKRWKLERCVHLANFSFLKINMYKDLERNEDKLSSNPIIAAIAGEHEPLHIPDGLTCFNHDNETAPINTFQVVDADSSQQDAILLSKRCVSFVLQGPPGTGKSQTITNIISEAMADGKKILFVSEKMAALQVVYNRLVNAGLGDFCFTLHNHKANKKEILRELANSISLDRKKVTDEAISQLYNLERKRECLNDYQQELHTPCSGLNKTIFEINGLLAKLSDLPELVFSFENVDKITIHELNDLIYLLRELSNTIGKRGEKYGDNVWRHSTVKFISNELRHDIDSNISSLLHILPNAEDIIEECRKKLDLSIENSVEGLDSLTRILAVAQQSPIIPEQWIFNADINQLLEDALIYKEQSEQINSAEEELQEDYIDQFFCYNGRQSKQYISGIISLLLEKINCESGREIAENASRLHSDLSIILNTADEIYRNVQDITDALGFVKPTDLKQIKRIVSFTEMIAVSSEIIPVDKWFDTTSLHEIKKSFPTERLLHEKLVDTRQTVLQTFDKEIFDLDYYPMLQRFRSDYSSSLRILKGSYRKDMHTLKAYLHDGAKLEYKDALLLLNLLKVIDDKTEEIEGKQQQYSVSYGQYYDGLNTDWDTLLEAMDLFEKVVSVIDFFPLKLRNLYKYGVLPVDEITKFNDLCKPICLERLQDQINASLKLSFSDSSSIEHLINECKSLTGLLEDFIGQYEKLKKLQKTPLDYYRLLIDLEKLAFVQSGRELCAKRNEDLLKQYSTYYTDEDTNWCELIDALKFAKLFKEVISENGLSKNFVHKICVDIKSVEVCGTLLSELKRIIEEIGKPLQWFMSLFDGSEPFRKYSFADLKDRLISCRDKKYLLDDWVDYCNNKQKCVASGLLSCVTDFEAKNIDPNQLPEAFLKRFYRLWLDAVLPLFPSVLNFRKRIQDQTIYEFNKLDKAQLKIAQARVRERVVSRMPDFNAVTSTRDEIGILKRELNKQRRLMPLRKLFMEIPNLITSLRPCFMMSPLSVSVFLEAKSYDFDLVIFDEASQVHTEDAIGAIMRGRQVIIVGDTQQLPPTNFFATSLNDEEYDMEDDEVKYSDAGSYDSILEEAVTVLPERSLRWHYRSRHENLIAFSNIKVYNRSLITFPASIERAQDYGVEYFYVSNGVYDRGGKRINVIEAQKVADLVFEHLQKYPERSLGVVTFSEPQQNAIDAAIRYKRYQNTAFESYFAEDKEEPFFIKNLENVQGDERDTIIFSIGYAKDQHGMMYMNFGPLSRDGGYRRLNVAITRAKYNVKLVGSIVPTDINIEKTSAEGVKLLRAYIEYAQNGVTAIEKEVSCSDEVSFDSPFEESVFAFLQSKGYDVATQVGCSGFRIDMAVKHPVYSGRFVIGIECDGATYHSARTVRERDRLRQTVLEEMGWTIYRIWSTDWIKDPSSQKMKLVAAVETALGHASSLAYTDSEESSEKIETTLNNLTIEESADICDEPKKGYCFIEYQQAHISDYISELNTEDIIGKVIEIEQPIHFEELCRRVAPLFGNQKATSKIRNEVTNTFKTYLSDKIRVENEFIMLHDFDNLQVRIPNRMEDYVRSITHISDEEISLAMRTIVDHSIGIVAEDLFIETARVFGYKRMGENIVSALKRVYTNMLMNGQFIEVEGKVSNT